VSLERMLFLSNVLCDVNSDLLSLESASLECLWCLDLSDFLLSYDIYLHNLEVEDSNTTKNTTKNATKDTKKKQRRIKL
jgi:hypothetical protein